MKKHIGSFVIMFCLLIAINCRKEKSDTPDYRNQYIGEWNFEVNRKSVLMDTSASQTISDTINYLGSIQYGIENDEIIIHYNKNSSLTFNLDEEGNLTWVEVPGYYAGAIFQNPNNIVLSYRGGPRYAYITESANGTKK